jgi:hypothetical protein
MVGNYGRHDGTKVKWPIREKEETLYFYFKLFYRGTFTKPKFTIIEKGGLITLKCFAEK